MCYEAVIALNSPLKNKVPDLSFCLLIAQSLNNERREHGMECGEVC